MTKNLAVRMRKVSAKPQSRSQSPRSFWSALTKAIVGSGNEIGQTADMSCVN